MFCSDAQGIRLESGAATSTVFEFGFVICHLTGRRQSFKLISQDTWNVSDIFGLGKYVNTGIPANSRGFFIAFLLSVETRVKLWGFS